MLQNLSEKYTYILTQHESEIKFLEVVNECQRSSCDI